MNKSELIEAIAASADIPKAAATRALDAMVESVTDSLKKARVFLWSVLVHLRSKSVLRVLAVTRRRVSPSKSAPPKYLALKPVKR